MKIIWTFTLLMIPGVVSPISVTGYSGGGVIIKCRYDEGYTTYIKYFCRGEWSECTDQIKTEEKDKRVNSGRFSLYDDRSAAVFTVTIRDLNEQDSEIYYCGTERIGRDLYTEVNLNITTGNVIINYKYEMKHENHEKYVCKTGADQCFTLINTNRTAEQKHVGRFSVHYDRSAHLLYVFIRELNVNDSGKYRIIVKVSKDYSFFSDFNLNIRDIELLSFIDAYCCRRICEHQLQIPQSHSADVKFVCRRSGSDLCAEETSVKESRRWSAEGQIQLYDDREQQLLTGTISHVTQQHSAEYWCGVQSDQGHKSFITRVRISVTDIPKTTLSQPPPLSSPSSSSPSSSLSVSSLSSVRTPLITGVSNSSPSSFTAAGSSLIVYLVLVLVLILILTGLLLLFFCKKHQTQGGDSSSQAGAGKHDLVSQTGHEYEDIKDTQKQLPTNPSDSSDCVYSTVQERTDDTQNFITSSEDLNYALVNFNKKADCPDSVSLRNNQDYCEYAAVNHLTA
ncbi:hypothetical protein Q8A67_005281 [Cirrhinus molitorella]|uniref:Immunoglobulin domain-containing protein n=1 Tax=Cirrhinus molitorella TaxID=172907 RepID=A0AA88Q2D0_9TELE|nr:hypothetical protein Q8A67_005281 [Cirrhinus molitorella]